MSVTLVSRHVLALVLLIALLAGCGQSLPTSIPPADNTREQPEDLSWLSRVAIENLLRFRVMSGARSGYAWIFARDGYPVYAGSAGWADVGEKIPMTTTTPMRMASMTKAVTAVAAMMLVEEGKLSLDDAVATYIPEFADSRVATDMGYNQNRTFDTEALAGPILVRHLLMFASGIGPGDEEQTDLHRYWEENGPRQQTAGTMGERIAKMAQFPLFEQPGTRWRYGWSADVLARVVEIASGQAYNEFLAERIFVPLGMLRTGFLFEETAQEELARVYTQNQEGELVEISPESDTDYPEGGSGLVSTAEDFLRFALMLANGGSYNGATLLQSETIDEMRQLHVASGVLAEHGIEGLGWGLGLSVVADAEATPFGDRDGDFWWSGYFGTTFFISPSTGLTGVVLSQNEPGPYSGLPIALYAAQGLAFAGL